MKLNFSLHSPKKMSDSHSPGSTSFLYYRRSKESTISDAHVAALAPAAVSTDDVATDDVATDDVPTEDVPLERKFQNAEPDDKVEVKETPASPWLEIWQRKGAEAFAKSKLHIANGFDQLTEAQHHEMMRYLLGPVLAVAPVETRSTERVLDLGCGAGAFIEQLVKMYGWDAKKCTGLDFSPTLVARCKASFPNTEVYEGNIVDLSRFKDGEFDRTFCFSVYFYLADVEAAKTAVREALRVTRSGGTVFLGDVSDATKYDLAMRLRNETHASQPKTGPTHLYLHKEVFTGVAEGPLGAAVRIVDHDVTPMVEYYNTAPYRFSVYLTKK